MIQHPIYVVPQKREMYEPGIYSISNEQYHQMGGISRSGIMEFRRSPRHFWHKYLNDGYVQKASTPDMQFGSAVHTYILEPEKFEQEYVIKPAKKDKLPEVPLLKDVGREEYDKAKAIYEIERKTRKADELSFYQFSLGKKQIAQEDFDKLKQMAASLKENPQTDGLLTDAQYEKSIFWIDKDTGLLCKARPDVWHDHFVVDLKTTADAAPRAFQRDYYAYGYHLQIAMIYEAIKNITGIAITDFIDLAIEKEEPYATAIYPIDITALEQGIKEFRHTLVEMKQCFDAGYFPSYKSQTISLPNYAMNED
jgi:hypothetical protein